MTTKLKAANLNATYAADQVLQTTAAGALSWGTVTTDTSGIEDDIALLGFKVAVAGSMAKYNLVDQTEDAFMDATGIDATESTNDSRNASNYYSGQVVYTGTGYGFAGGSSTADKTHAGGGGGGASAVGQNAPAVSTSGNGGAGRSNVFRTGVAQVYGSGGGGGIWSGGGGGGGTNAGAGGVGNGAPGDATANFGGGGGGCGGQASVNAGGNGGSGIVIIRYLAAAAAGTGGAITTYGSGASQYQVHSFTNSAASENLVLASGVTMDIMIVAGGGAGGGMHAGGGGGGGVMEITGWEIAAGTYAAVVGAGATGVTAAGCGGTQPSGTDTSFNATQTAKGGGGGGTYCISGGGAAVTGVTGGSGGGAAGGGTGPLTGGGTNQGQPALGDISNMTLVSNSTTANDGAPTKGDIVMTYANGTGTAAINTDITAEYSADGGTSWTSTTLVAQGTTGTASPHFIVSAHDVARTSLTGTSMVYRIKTLNQSAAKETRIQAVSLGWS